MLWYVMVWYVIVCYSILFHSYVMLCYFMFWFVMLCYGVLCYAIVMVCYVIVCNALVVVWYVILSSFAIVWTPPLHWLLHHGALLYTGALWDPLCISSTNTIRRSQSGTPLWGCSLVVCQYYRFLFNQVRLHCVLNQKSNLWLSAL